MKSTLGIVFLLLSLTPIVHADNKTPPSDMESSSTPTLELLSVQANALGVFQQAGGYSITGEVSWAPVWHLSQKFNLRGNFGVSLLNSTFSTYYLMFDYELLIGWRMSTHLELALAGGAQTWVSNGTAPLFGPYLTYYPSARLFGLIDRIFLGANAVLVPNNLTIEPKLGIGASF